MLLEVWKSGFSRMDLFKRFHPCKYLNWSNLRKLRMKLVFSKQILEYKVQIFKVKKSLCSIAGVKFWRGFRGRGEAETEGQEKAEEKSRCQEKEEQEVEASSAVIQ